MRSMVAIIVAVCSLTCAGSSVTAQPREPGGIRENEIQVRDWNRFAERLLAVHRHFVKTRELRKTETTGGYAGRPKFYKEISYRDAGNGRLVSRLQWETAHPANLHSIELYFYDDAGRVIRDYQAAFLPEFRNAPIRASVWLHGYESGLHAFRQYDASGDALYEACRGEWLGKPVDISNPEPMVGTSPALRASEEYLACFGFVPFEPGRYVDPRSGIEGLQPRGGTEQRAGGVPTDLQAKIAYYTDRIKRFRNVAGFYEKRGQAYFEALEFDKAISDFSRALELDPSLDQAYFGRGMALGRAGRLKEGISDLTAFIERNPNSSLGYTKRGVRHIWNRDMASAEKDLRRAIALDPRNAEAHDDLGAILAHAGRHAAALEHFATTIRLDGSYQKAYHNMALVHFLTGRHEEALRVLERGLKLRLGPRSSLELKAKILRALGRNIEAESTERSSAALPDNNWTERLSVR